MPHLVLEFEKCVVKHGNEYICCPYVHEEPTEGAGCATDYFCKLVPDPRNSCGYRTTSGYVEWPREINPVPNWCPIRVINT